MKLETIEKTKTFNIELVTTEHLKTATNLSKPKIIIKKPSKVKFTQIQKPLIVTDCPCS